ncbi:anti-sigma B factor antagonist [Selenomonas sp. GACV-9]|uniref:STAS domain-containing protein n=1 Tax=Selenomonas sp. GACV-9 TaxID=3158782 RepID=UPI0008EE255E|nr:anti-sigma B factor antagonist [Selenomonas ruminantium]
MDIKQERQGTTLKLALSGRMDAVTAPQFNTLLEKELDGVTELILDLAGLEYIASAGLHSLLIAQKRMKHLGEMKLIHVGDNVRDIFEMTGFSSFLTIESAE